MIFEKMILTVITLPFIGILLYSFFYPEDVLKKKSPLHEEAELTLKPSIIRFTKWSSLIIAIVTILLMTLYLFS